MFGELPIIFFFISSLARFSMGIQQNPDGLILKPSPPKKYLFVFGALRSTGWRICTDSDRETSFHFQREGACDEMSGEHWSVHPGALINILRWLYLIGIFAIAHISNEKKHGCLGCLGDSTSQFWRLLGCWLLGYVSWLVKQPRSSVHPPRNKAYYHIWVQNLNFPGCIQMGLFS